MTKFDSVLNSIAEVRRQTSSALVFVSFGKDSLALLDLIYPHFETLIAVFMSFVPGLEHIEKYRRWCAVRYPNVKWMEVEHWNMTYIRRSGMYCEPEPEVKTKKLADVIADVREATGIEWVFLGMKKADSLNRRLMLMQYEQAHYTNNGVCYPLAEMTNKDVLAYLKAHKLPAPVSYGKGASNGLGFNLDCFLWMRDNAPGDLEKIYREFPLSRRILFEYDRRNEREQDY